MTPLVPTSLRWHTKCCSAATVDWPSRRSSTLAPKPSALDQAFAPVPANAAQPGLPQEPALLMLLTLLLMPTWPARH